MQLEIVENVKFYARYSGLLKLLVKDQPFFTAFFGGGACTIKREKLYLPSLWSVNLINDPIRAHTCLRGKPKGQLMTGRGNEKGPTAIKW